MMHLLTETGLGSNIIMVLGLVAMFIASGWKRSE